MADFYIRRRQRVRIEQLYVDNPDSSYHYTNGVNWRNVTAFGLAGAVTMIIALVNAFDDVAAFSWPIGVVLGASLSLLFQDRKQTID